MALVLDAGGVSRLSERSSRVVALVRAFERVGLWPPVVPTVVLVESITGRPGTDVATNRLLKTCDVQTDVSESLARRAAELRTKCGRGSAADALVVAIAEPAGTVLTGDVADIGALVAHAVGVHVERV